MSKIKVVQIALATVEVYNQYIDDKGRLWVTIPIDGAIHWRRIELPDEPADQPN